MVQTMFAAGRHEELLSAEPGILKAATPNVAQVIAQFEILSQPVAPVQDVPYVQQGFFVQIANLQNAEALLTLNFISTPVITNNPTAPIKIFADYIVNNGAPVFYNAFFLSPVGFASIAVPAFGTIIFGVQYIYNPQTTSPQMVGTTPQQSASSRGYVSFASNIAGRFGVLPTIRQVFTTFDANLKPIAFSSSAYAVPLISLVNV